MRIFLIMILSLLTSFDVHATKVNGFLQKDENLLPVNVIAYAKNDTSFPKKHYEIMSMAVGRDLNEEVILRSGKKIEPNTFGLITGNGKLDLVNYDRKSGQFIFRLSMLANNILDIDINSQSRGEININSNVNFGSENYIYITGKVTHINNKLVLDSTDKNFTLLMDDQNDLVLTAIRDIPLSIDVK